MTRSILLVGVARAVSIGLGVILLGVLGRRLGPGGFGTLQFALALMAYPALLVDLGLTTLGLREIAKGMSSRDVIRDVLVARLVLAFGVLTVVTAGIIYLPLDAESKSIFAVLTLGLPGLALNARWVLQGERRFGRAAIVDVVTTGAQLLGVVALVSGTGDVLWAAIALTLATWVATTVSILMAGKWSRFPPHIGRSVTTVIVRSLPLGAAAIAITVYYGIDTVLLGVFRNAEEVAYYAAAYRIILPILALAGAAGTVAIPHLTSLMAGDAALADQATVSLSRRMILVALPIAAGGALVAEPIVQVVYGSQFAPAATPFGILVFSVVTVYANAAFSFLLLARQGDRRYLLATVAGAAVNVGLNLVAIPLAGMLGAALTTIVSEITVLALILWWTRDVSRAAALAALRAAAVPTLVMCLVVWSVRESILAVAVGVVVYCLVAALTGAVPIARWIGPLRRSKT